MIHKSVGRRNRFEPHYNNVKVQLARVRCILSRLFPGPSKELNDDAVVYFQLSLICPAAIRGRHSMAEHAHAYTLAHVKYTLIYRAKYLTRSTFSRMCFLFFFTRRQELIERQIDRILGIIWYRFTHSRWKVCESRRMNIHVDVKWTETLGELIRQGKSRFVFPRYSIRVPVNQRGTLTYIRDFT